MFIVGTLYRRQSLHETFGGQKQGGISTPSNRSLVFLFSSPRAREFGYEDGWSEEEGVYLYTGEGQRGDMAFTRGNAAIRDHQDEGRDLHLFEASSKKGFYRYIGQMLCIGYHERQGKDITGKERSKIVFELISIDTCTEEMNTEIEETLWQGSLQNLRNRALSFSFPLTVKQRQIEIYNRSQAVRIYALKRANGTCEGCGKKAPFLKEDGTPYLEVHHLNRLSDGGPDHPNSVIALCSNCHRQAHYSIDRTLFNARLKRIVADIEEKSIRSPEG
ncbi:MAG: HNH endonuclease [Theionarchaea archaeon]|nr:HNH endonuclease [Theionarchaea archaeon]MBU7021685.1 HNH endonuclease [Theionarchaea archaeon]